MAEVKRYALIDAEGNVENVVLWDGDRDNWQPEEHLTPHLLADDEAVGTGHARVGGEWIPPELAEDEDKPER